MRKLAIIFILVCATLNSVAQTNFVKNPGFEKYDTCPYTGGQIPLCQNWHNAVEPNFILGIEYFNSCAAGNYLTDCPVNGAFYQNPHLGNGMVGIGLYYDKTSPPPPPGCPLNHREYLQTKLINTLIAGTNYCISFWIYYTESSGYAHNKMGAYLDNGNINFAVDSGGKEITSVIPQVFTNSILDDTVHWVKIEGSFVATGAETHLTIGNYFTNAATSVIKTNYWAITPQYSYYLIDDVSIIPVNLNAVAGKDSHAELGKKVQIGRVGDTTALGLDCKWYRKGVLIDSGAIISVNAGASVGKIDTYVVVQTICGLVKTDTVTVKTVPVGFREYNAELEFSVYPNPSNGAITLTTPHAVIPQGSLHAKVYDLLGRAVYQNQVSFSNNQASLHLNVADGVYILELTDNEGDASRQRIEIRK